MRYVAVVGPGDAADGDLVVAHDVGRLLAERGTVVLTGGLGGVMEAAARGAARAGGTSVGLLPGSDRRGANPHSTLTLPTGLGELRNGVLVRGADGVVAVGGSWGTLSEVALAVRSGTPVVQVGGWQVLDADGRPVGPPRADTAADAVRTLLGDRPPGHDLA
ncbi:TIGR00725 family protein [Angustibacter aerolatus]